MLDTCSLFHLSSGYSTDKEGRRNVFTWNRDRVPDVDAMVKHFRSNNIELAANIKPWCLNTHPLYNEVFIFIFYFVYFFVKFHFFF